MSWSEGEYGWATKWVSGPMEPKTEASLRIRRALAASRRWDQTHPQPPSPKAP